MCLVFGADSWNESIPPFAIFSPWEKSRPISILISFLPNGFAPHSPLRVPRFVQHFQHPSISKHWLRLRTPQNAIKHTWKFNVLNPKTWRWMVQMIFLFKEVVSRFHLNFQGCTAYVKHPLPGCIFEVEFLGRSNAVIGKSLLNSCTSCKHRRDRNCNA